MLIMCACASNPQKPEGIRSGDWVTQIPAQTRVVVVAGSRQPGQRVAQANAVGIGRGT